jgi:hypothetical protein
LIITALVVLADEADDYDDKRAHDAYMDARYDSRHVHDGVPVDEARHAAMADVVVPADAVAAVRMHTCLLAGINMRICTFS